MSTDPNWLLSTAAQSAAALVAIIAGFIINKLLALSADRISLKSRLQDTQLSKNAKKATLDSLEQRLLERDAFDFIEDSDVLGQIVQTEGNISLEGMLRAIAVTKRSQEELRPFWDHSISIVKDAFRILRDSPTQEFYETGNFDSYWKELGLDLSAHDAIIYERVLLELIEAGVSQDFTYIQGMKIPLPESFTVTMQKSDALNAYRTLQHQIESLQWELRDLESQESALRWQLKSLEKPAGLLPGLLILAYFSIVGILVPLFLLPAAPENFTPLEKWLIFTLFSSGLIALFVYLFILVRQPNEQ